MIYPVFKVIAWSLAAFVAMATLSPIGLRPHLFADADLERALALLVVGFAFAVAYPTRVTWVGIILLLGIIGLEWAQQILPDRHGRLHDAFVKAAFAGLGVGLGWALTRRAGRFS